MAFAAPDQSQVVPGQLNPQQAQNAPIAAGGAGIGGSSKAANTPGQNVPAQPSAQLSAYLSANQPQAEGLASNIAGQVGQTVNAAGQAILPAVNTYTGNLYNVPTDTGVNQAVTQSPASLTPDQQATYETELGAAAKAPNSANTFETTQPYQDLTSQIQSAVNNANLWNVGNNPATISTALQPFEAPSTTQGGSTLDAILLSQTPGAASQLQAAAEPAADLQGYLTQQAGTADAALQAAIAQDQAATQASQGAGNTYVQNLTDTLNTAVSNARSAAEQGNTTLLTDLQNQTVTPADLQAMGITQDQWDALDQAVVQAQTPQTVTSQATPNSMNAAQGSGQYQAQSAAPNFDLTQYLTQQNPNAAITSANIATPQNYADLAALESMMGTAMPGVIPINDANAAQAGTAPANLNSYNYANALGGAQGQYNAETAAAQAYVNALQQGSDEAHARDAAANVAQNETEAGTITQLSNPIGWATLAIPGAAKFIGTNEGAIANASPSSGSIAGDVALNAALDMSTLGIAPAVNAIVSAVSCFVADTPIIMADGRIKPIQHIKVGDATKGGEVTFITQGRSSDLYDYNSVIVTGGHYVKEDEKWIDVAHAERSRKIKCGEVPVYDFCTDRHSIWSNGVEFSDAITMVFFDLAYTKGEKTLAHQYLEKLLSKVPVGA